MFDFLKPTRCAVLDSIIERIEMNVSNNYKDAAQLNLKELEAKFQALDEAGKLNGKQKNFYACQIDAFKDRMKNFTHKDQKPYWT